MKYGLSDSWIRNSGADPLVHDGFLAELAGRDEQPGSEQREARGLGNFLRAEFEGVRQLILMAAARGVRQIHRIHAVAKRIEGAPVLIRQRVACQEIPAPLVPPISVAVRSCSRYQIAFWKLAPTLFDKPSPVAAEYIDV